MKLLYEAWRANDALDWTIAAGIALACLLALVALKYAAGRVLASLSARAGAVYSTIAIDVVAATRVWVLIPVAAAVGASALELPQRLERIIGTAAMVVVMLQAALWVNRFIDSWLARGVARQRIVDSGVVTALELIGFAARTAVWGLMTLFVLSHLGFNVTALVAGLGVGGVAVALAVQNILGDLFASLSIVLDKPFVVGDFIVVDSLRGSVERVGIKTTRIRSLDGELLVISNADLLKSRIRNFKRMLERRVEFTIGVSYHTPAEKLRRIPQWLREIVEAQPRVRFDRAHCKEYSDTAIVFEIVYCFGNPDYNAHMDTRQAINLAIFERFTREKIRFAHRDQAIQPAPVSLAEVARA